MTRREQLARDAGNLAGRGNIHSMHGNYKTGAEYIAWLKGWRAGQRELADQIQRATGMPRRAAAMIVGISERV